MIDEKKLIKSPSGRINWKKSAEKFYGKSIPKSKLIRTARGGVHWKKVYYKLLNQPYEHSLHKFPTYLQLKEKILKNKKTKN